MPARSQHAPFVDIRRAIPSDMTSTLPFPAHLHPRRAFSTWAGATRPLTSTRRKPCRSPASVSSASSPPCRCSTAPSRDSGRFSKGWPISCRPRTPTETCPWIRQSLFLTAGASQGIDLATTIFAKSGDTVFVEEPTYYLIGRIFLDHGLKVVGVPTDRDGLDVDALELMLQDGSPTTPALRHTDVPEPHRGHLDSPSAAIG